MAICRLFPLRLFPAGIVIDGENPLNAFGPAAAAVVEDLQSLTDFLQAGILVRGAGIAASTDAIEDGGQVQQFAAGFQKIIVQGFGTR